MFLINFCINFDFLNTTFNIILITEFLDIIQGECLSHSLGPVIGHRHNSVNIR